MASSPKAPLRAAVFPGEAAAGLEQPYIGQNEKTGASRSDARNRRAYRRGLSRHAGFFSDIWSANPAFVVLNGNAAVMFFFVLSGYVLTKSVLEKNDLVSIARGCVKRWPRLAAPVTVAVLLSWALWHCGAYWGTHPELIYDHVFSPGGHDMSLRSAAEQGVFRTFAFGEDWFDPPLWTMKWEASGSIVVFALAALLIAVRNRVAQGALLVLALPFPLYQSELYLTFWLGLLLAWIRSFGEIGLRPAIAIPLVCVSIYLLGYVPNVLGYHRMFDFYAWARPIDAILGCKRLLRSCSSRASHSVLRSAVTLMVAPARGWASYRFQST